LETTQNPNDPFKKDALYQGQDKFSPIPLTVSSPKINPIDKRLVKATAFETMQYQANQQISIIKQQAELLMEQARKIEERMEISRKIYEADLNFEPVIGTTYHVYEKNGRTVLSLVAPNEWGKKMPFDHHVCSATLLGDKSWDLVK
jgi:superfamily I DNA and/or RNA helicase